MYSVIWNKKGNYPLLTDGVIEGQKVLPPRPVYFEELDLFGMDKHWSYPHCEAPLLWAIGRSYYYKGIEVARVNGGSLISEPIIDLIHSGHLQPVDVEKMLNDNCERLATLENEAKFFIKETEMQISQNEQLCVAYSGGKDSQVVLELVSQVVPPDEYVVIYTNTGMELPGNPQNVQAAISYYKSKFPELKFVTAKSRKDMVLNWKYFGPPSRMHRWCCSVAKSVPFYVVLSSHSNKSSYVVFEGVRREESNSRNSYERSADQVKHSLVRNVRPIIDWNDTEVYMYLMYRDLKINPLYRVGLTRVGCSICPFSSDWSEYIISKIAPGLNDRFYRVVSEAFQHNGISDPIKQNRYIREGKWKVRGGDKILSEIPSSIRVASNEDCLSLRVTNPQCSIFEWIKIFDYHLSEQEKGRMDLVIRHKQKTANYEIDTTTDGFIVRFKAANSKEVNQDFVKILNKVTFCYSCLACMIECPTGAISFNPNLKIDQGKCIKCHNCIIAINKGCHVATSRSITIVGERMSKTTKNPDRYSTFGLRESWLIAHLSSTEDWIDALGSKQITAVRKWLSEAELMKENKRTELLKILSILPMETVWGIVWANLCYNSEIVSWYQGIEYKFWNRIDLQKLLLDDYSQYSEGTVKNPLNALLNTFDNSEIISSYYGQGIVGKKGNKYESVNKTGVNRVDNAVLIYVLYKFASSIQSNSLTLDQLFDVNVKHNFVGMYGIDRRSVADQLTSLQEHRSKLVRVEFVANLDNIFLIKDLSATEALRIYLEG